MAIADFIRELTRLLEPRWVLTRRGELAAYSYDETGEKHLPEVVALPGDAGEVAAAVTLAARHGVAVVARGAGTGASGGSIPVTGGLVLSLQRLDRVLSIDPDSRRAVVEPGVRNLALQDALRPHGLFFAPDPASQLVSTIGGNIAENAGGPHCLKYGVTSNHVCGLEVVLADGSLATLGGAAEDGPGYDLAGLVVGSEGTLAIVTKAVVRLLPLPEKTATLLAVFGRLEDAVAAVSSIIDHRIIPAALELMDHVAIQVVQQSMDAGYPPDAGAALVIDVDGMAAEVAAQIPRIEACLRANGVTEVRTASDEAQRAALWLGRRSVGSAMARWSRTLWGQDVTVPRDRLPELLRRNLEIARRHGLKSCTVAHAGDGNCHPMFAYDPADPAQARGVREANQELVAACVEMGGSITGEHGVGIDKLSNLPLMFTPGELDYMCAVRDALNPRGILNPGKKLPMRRAGF